MQRIRRIALFFCKGKQYFEIRKIKVINYQILRFGSRRSWVKACDERKGPVMKSGAGPFRSGWRSLHNNIFQQSIYLEESKL